MQEIEKLGAFYLGTVGEAASGAAPSASAPLLLDSRAFTTHAVILGMTGSGKTGLGISLIEEAAIDGVPAIVIDPKGDLADLLLTFPELKGEDFLPYVDVDEARRQGITPEEMAAKTAAAWREGLVQTGQNGERIRRMRSAAEFALYTPGGTFGRPLSVLRSFAAPDPSLREDEDAMRDRTLGAVSGLLALLGIDADPVRSREHVLLSALIGNAWQKGEDLDLGSLVRLIQDPPLTFIGVLDLETYYPAKERQELALLVNNLLASPGFAAWTEGESLDIARLLTTRQGKPRVSVLSLAHLGEAERMFFVTILLHEIVAWTRAQSGTGSLRALLYMDEVLGFFPPSANPPSKPPMLTLLKQARAFGVGVVLSTQNPVDLDYKGLGNAGTWFIGRLQTERDQARVLDGLEAASVAADRGELGALLGGLQKRQFLLYSARGEAPALFRTRWTLSYLAGPLSRERIRGLAREGADQERAAADSRAGGVSGTGNSESAAAESGAAPGATAAPDSSADSRPAGSRPALPAEIPESFLPPPADASGTMVYRPVLRAKAQVHYVSAPAAVDLWETLTVEAPLPADLPPNPWDGALRVERAGAAPPSGTPGASAAGMSASPASGTSAAAPSTLESSEPPRGARFAELPAAAARAKSYAVWTRGLADALYRTRTLELYSCPDPKMVSKPGETEEAFRARLALRVREVRDGLVDKLRKKYDAKVAALQDRIRRAEERVERERSQYDQQQIQTAISVGSTLVSALLGGRRGIGGMTTAARGAGRAGREKQDIARAQADLTTLRGQLAEIEGQLAAEACRIQEGAGEPVVSPFPVRPRKSDILVERLGLVWVPETGMESPEA